MILKECCVEKEFLKDVYLGNVNISHIDEVLNCIDTKEKWEQNLASKGLKALNSMNFVKNDFIF